MKQLIYKRQYIQFNDFVFYNATSDDPTTSFKSNTQTYTFKHGVYSPQRGDVLAEEGDVSLDISIRMKNLPCDARPFYLDFVIGQLRTPGKLWSVWNNTLLWAWAEMKQISEATSSKDGVDISVEFRLPEGVWHKADLQKTFLKPWDICDFMDCYEFKELKPCVPLEGECCTCGDNHPVGCTCCDCQGLSKEMALCYNTEELQRFYYCDAGYKVVYSCEAADRYFGDLTNYQGTKMCTACGTIIGTLYSNTNIDTPGIKIRFTGEVKNPYIEINGNANKIKGSYENLTIYPDGTFTHGCEECMEGNVENWIVPKGNVYGWDIHQGNNRVIIETGNCCGVVCAYIMVDPLTY